MQKLPEIRRGYCVGLKDGTFRFSVSKVGVVYLTLLFSYILLYELGVEVVTRKRVRKNGVV